MPKVNLLDVSFLVPASPEDQALTSLYFASQGPSTKQLIPRELTEPQRLRLYLSETTKVSGDPILGATFYTGNSLAGLVRKICALL